MSSQCSYLRRIFELRLALLQRAINTSSWTKMNFLACAFYARPKLPPSPSTCCIVVARKVLAESFALLCPLPRCQNNETCHRMRESCILRSATRDLCLRHILTVQYRLEYRRIRQRRSISLVVDLLPLYPFTPDDPLSQTTKAVMKRCPQVSTNCPYENVLQVTQSDLRLI